MTKSKFLSVIPKYFANASKRYLFWRRKSKENPYVVLRVTPEDHCNILQLMWQHYYPEEPTTVALGLGHKYNPTFDDFVLKDLSEGLSYVAKCKYTGEIVGASINKTQCPWDPDLTDEFACNLSCHKIRQLLHFYAYLTRAPCLFEKYCTPKIFELSQLVVRRPDRGKGVGVLLVNTSRRLGADCGYRVVRVDATSHYTAQLCDRLKMTLVHEVPYCSYVGKSLANEPVIKPPPPHCSCKIYIDTPHLQE